MEIINGIMQNQGAEVFSATSRAPMGQFSRTFKALNTQIRTSPGQNLPLTLSTLDDLIVAQELLVTTAMPKDSIDSLRREITTLEREAKSVGGLGIGDIIEDVKRRAQNILTLPFDAGITDLTTDVHPPPVFVSQINQ